MAKKRVRDELNHLFPDREQARILGPDDPFMKYLARQLEGKTVPSIEETRRILNEELGERSLTEELMKMRDESF